MEAVDVHHSPEEEEVIVRTTLPNLLLTTRGRDNNQAGKQEAGGNASVELEQCEPTYGVCIHPSLSSLHPKHAYSSGGQGASYGQGSK